MTSRTIAGMILAVVFAASDAGCAKTEPTPPSETLGPATTITISRTGASPRNLTVPLGSRITFVNNDSIVHQMYSDPHPEHADCPEFDSVGQLSPGQSRETTNLVTSRTCNFHDHLDFANDTLKGAIVIQ